MGLLLLRTAIGVTAVAQGGAYLTDPGSGPAPWLAGGILIAFAAKPEQLIGSATYHFARATVYAMMNIYVVKMACVFMITTSTIALYTAIAPRWLAILGYVLALLVLFGSYQIAWSFVVFPLWVFITSTYILVDNISRPHKG